MTKVRMSSGAVHKVPADLSTTITNKAKAYETWEDITPLARNEWICWVESAKQLETRQRRIRIAGENLAKGKRRPCCWAGCPHR
ncbi:MAG: YdeI/OmpD-associated family protein [Candidatus Pacebacteria bacterium]|nr:YdeI/OmpD-associated family protein [Candidatus Paceibacterota bacterium]